MKKKIDVCRKIDTVLGSISLIVLVVGMCFMDSEALIPVPLIICLTVGIPTALATWFFRKLTIYYRLQERKKRRRKAA